MFRKIFDLILFALISFASAPCFSVGKHWDIQNVGDDKITVRMGASLSDENDEFRFLEGVIFTNDQGKLDCYTLDSCYMLSPPRNWTKNAAGKYEFHERTDKNAVESYGHLLVIFKQDSKYYVGEYGAAGMNCAELDDEKSAVDAFTTIAYLYYYALRYNMSSVDWTSAKGAVFNEKTMYLPDFLIEPEEVFVRGNRLHYKDGKWYTLNGDKSVVLSDGKMAKVFNGQLMFNGRAASDVSNYDTSKQLSFSSEVWQLLKEYGTFSYVHANVPSEHEIGAPDGVRYHIRATGAPDMRGRIAEPEYKTVGICSIPVKYGNIKAFTH